MNNDIFSLALLVEDELHLISTLKIAFQKLKIPLLCATTLKEASQLMSEQTPEFILLDRSLPDGDGLNFCTNLRQKNFQGSILILTASGEIGDRVLGLNLGADDYLPKPFSWDELEARIRALARRKIKFLHPNLIPPLWKLDADQLKILGPKGWVQLTPLEYKLAVRMIQAQNVIISRDELLKEVWGFTLLPKTRTVDHFLGRLRKHFEEDSDHPTHFLTIRGAGYKFHP